MKQIGYMARDQYGNTFHIGDNPPRKWLLEHFGRQHVDKMYCNTISGGCRHKGYVIAGYWLTIYRVCQWKD